jgi:hypothetical protein
VLNTLVGATALKTLVQGLEGVGNVQLGVPESTSKRVDVAITVGSQTLTRKTTSSTARDARYLVVFAYRVDKDEAGAEAALMNLIDAFITAVHEDLTLGKVCRDTTLDMGLADTPEYILRTATEFREYPIVVTLKQYGSYNPNP